MLQSEEKVAMNLDLSKKRTKRCYNFLANLEGVYFFLDENRKPIYIGRSDNLKRRLLHHKAETEKEMPERRFLLVLLTDRSREREAYFLRLHDPKYNRENICKKLKLAAKEKHRTERSYEE